MSVEDRLDSAGNDEDTHTPEKSLLTPNVETLISKTNLVIYPLPEKQS